MVFAMISTRSSLGLLIGGVGILGTAAVVLFMMAPPIRAGDQVKVTIVAVLATSQNKNVDPKLECLAKEVQKTHPNLTGFRIERCSCKELFVGDKYKFPLVDDETAVVGIQRGPGKEDRVDLTIKPPKGGDIVYTSCCGKFFHISTRYQTKDKEQLIIAIRVQCCDKKKNPEAK